MQTETETLSHLTHRSTGAILVIALALFIGLNPVWERWDIASADANILWSYVPIPFLVAGFLALERKLGLATFVVETIKITLIKFGITYVIANTAWAVFGPPERLPEDAPAQRHAGSGAHEPRAAPPATPLDPSRTGGLDGVVVNAGGGTRGGAVVYVSRGLEAFAFDPPEHALELVNTGAGFTPRLSVVQTFQVVSLRADDGDLHTALATDAAGRLVFNYPALSKASRTVMFDRPLGVVALTCTVHGDAEPAAHIAIAGHPFAQITGDDGRFTFSGVPVGELELSVWTEEGTRSEAVAVRAGARTELTVRLP